MKNAIGIFIEIALNLQIASDDIDILTILSFAIHEHKKCLSIYFFFHFFQQCFTVFSIEDFNLLDNIYS